MERRNFFRALVAGGASVTDWPKSKNRRVHHAGDRLYHGPMIIPPDVAEAIRESPDLHRTTARHLVSKFVSHDGMKWLFRCRIPESRAMIGEIVRTPEGAMRVHCWTVARPASTYRTVEELIPHRTLALPAPAANPLEWKTELLPPSDTDPLTWGPE